MMMSLGVYVLGAADAGERRLLEAHLPGCRDCQRELRRLAPLPGLLAGVPVSVRDPSAAPVRQAVPTRRAAAPARAAARGSTRLRWAAAAAAFLAAVGTGSGLWLSSGGGRQPAGVTLAAADPATHVSATAILTPTEWGSSIQLRMRGLPENVDCRLVIRAKDGRTETGGVWDAWRPGPVSVPASASWLPSDIASLEVATVAGNLLTISASSPAAGAGS
jgi:anti-sigma-K factor RskA